MARNKNAKRLHEIAEYIEGQDVETVEKWYPLAKWVTDIQDESEDNTEDYADYAGDGTVATDVTGVKVGWSYEGTYDKDDPAQAMINKIKMEIGEKRKVWQRVTESEGKVRSVGKATVMDIITGSGEASGYEEFSCKIMFDQKPTTEEVV